jgi:hypothetical protein
MKSLDDGFTGGARRHRLSFDSAAEREEFHNSYPPEEQDSVRDLHDLMMRIDEAPNRHRGSKSVQNARWSAKRLEALHAEWVAAGRDWRVLVNKAKYPDAREPRLPQEFRDFIREKFSANQRVNAAPYRQIIRQWDTWLRTGDPRFAIPGYVDTDGFPVAPKPGRKAKYPDGWSLRNLNRFAPSKAELTMARIGVAAAMVWLPKIPGTREGVRFLEYVSGDDVWLKRKVCVEGFGAVRVVQFGLMDYAASYYLDGFVQRPVLPRRDGTTERLKRRDFLWTVALMLERYGFPLDYVMHLICERGTATMSKAEARFLYEISDGHIIVGWSTMEGEVVAAWEERQSGNSNAKGWHESFHNLYANEEADLPGQVGKDRDHSPAALLGRERAAVALNDLAMILSPEQRAALPMPFPGVRECYAQSMQRVGWINDRKEHGCKDFDQVMDWRPRGLRIQPLPESELPRWMQENPRVTRDNIDEMVEWFPRPESPRERMLKLSQGERFQRLPNAVYRRFYEDLHICERVAADLSLAFTCKQTGRKLRFEPATPQEAIAPGTKVTGFYRPDGTAIHLFGGNDAYLLTWPAVKANRRADAEGKQADYERKKSFINAAIANVRADRRDEIKAAAADAQQIARVMAEAHLLPNEDADSELEAAPGAHSLAAVQDGCSGSADAVREVTQAIKAAKAQGKARQRSQQNLSDLADAALSQAGDRLNPDPTEQPHDYDCHS